MKKRKEILQNRNDILQWIGAILIVLGHILNGYGPKAYPYNIIVFTLGTILFLIWAYRVKNTPQLTVNIISLTIMFMGLYKAFY